MKRVIIIGAGPAGLTAANELLKIGDFDVIVLEEANDIGGISKTVQYNGNRMDIGGHRFFSKDEKILKYWKSIMPIQGYNSFDDKKLSRVKELEIGGPDPEKTDNVMLIRNRVSRIYYLKKFFDYPITMKKETLKNMGLKKTLKAGCSYIKSVFIRRKENSLKLWGRHPSQISADWGSQRVKGLSIGKVLKDLIIKPNNKNIETSLIEEFWYPKFGPGQLWEILANNITKNGGKILKKYKVTEILIINNKINSVVCNFEGKKVKFEGDIFISSMPLKDFVCGINNKKVPSNILEIAKGLPYIDFQTVGVLVKKLKIKNETKIKTLSNIVPDCWVYVQEPDVKMLRFQIFNNWSPYMVEKPEETVWIGLEYTCLENDSYWNMNDNEFINFSIDELVKIGIIDKSYSTNYTKF